MKTHTTTLTDSYILIPRLMQVGVLEKVCQGPDGKLYATVRYDAPMPDGSTLPCREDVPLACPSIR